MSDLWIPQEAPPGMEFLHLAWDPEAQWVACWLMAVTPARPCPTCGTLSDRVHTSYVRQPDELPVGDRRLRFFVVARRFWCDQPECQWCQLSDIRIHRIEVLVQRFEKSAGVFGMAYAPF